MYDELIKRLYYCRNNAAIVTDGELVEIAEQAADAIEELSKKYLASEVDNTNLTGWLAEEHAKNRWIPVTERKPKTDDIVIVAIHDDSGDTPYDVTNVGFYLDVFPLGIWVVEGERCNYVTHWMPLPEPLKEE